MKNMQPAFGAWGKSVDEIPDTMKYVATSYI
jgi:hypothetical protein